MNVSELSEVRAGLDDIQKTAHNAIRESQFTHSHTEAIDVLRHRLTLIALTCESLAQHIECLENDSSPMIFREEEPVIMDVMRQSTEESVRMAFSCITHE